MQLIEQSRVATALKNLHYKNLSYVRLATSPLTPTILSPLSEETLCTAKTQLQDSVSCWMRPQRTGQAVVQPILFASTQILMAM